MTLRSEIEALTAKVRAGMAPSETAVVIGEMLQIAIRAGQVERLADEMVANAMEEALQPPPAPVVVRFPERRRVPVQIIGEGFM